MLAWSDGASSKEALRLGVMAGMGAALKEGGTINKFMTSIKQGNENLLSAVSGGLEIEMKKAAADYKRSRSATTGELNMDRLPLYQLKDDIFDRIQVVRWKKSWSSNGT